MIKSAEMCNIVSCVDLQLKLHICKIDFFDLIQFYYFCIFELLEICHVHTLLKQDLHVP